MWNAGSPIITNTTHSQDRVEFISYHLDRALECFIGRKVRLDFIEDLQFGSRWVFRCRGTVMVG